MPAWIVEGYQTLLGELADQLADLLADQLADGPADTRGDQPDVRADRGRIGADLIAVPVGVGSLAQAVVADAHGRARSSRVLACEPDTAAGVLASLDAGRRISVATGTTVMAGLNCGTPSALAWPYLRDGLDAAVAVPDDAAVRAVAVLAGFGIEAGASGAAALAGAAACLEDERRRAELELPPEAVVVLLNTEGAAGAGGLA